MDKFEKEEEGTLYEAGRAVIQLRAVVAVVKAILENMPPSAKLAIETRATQAVANDPGAARILAAGLHIERDRAGG